MSRPIKSKQLNIRLTPEEHSNIKSKADLSDLSIAVYLTKLASHNIHITLTDIQFKTLARKAELSGVSVSEFISDAIMSKKVPGFKKSDITGAIKTDDDLPGQMNIKDYI